MYNLIPQFIVKKFIQSIYHGELHATAIFIDISGFTKLTETLAQFKKEGVETLSLLISRLFTPAIECVYAYEGFITHFAGDAFMAIFENEENAVNSALEIIKHFEMNKNQKTKILDIDINAKIGISYGNIEWGIIGNETKSYYFKGEAVNNCGFAEKECSPMDIVIDKKLYDRISELYSFQKIDNGFFKLLPDESNNKIKLNKQQRNYPADQEILKKFTSNIIIENNPKDELRNILSVFISIRNIDTHHDLNAFFISVYGLCTKYGAYFSRISFGDKGATTLINLGIPISYEDNIKRSLLFIDDLRTKYKDNIRTGITFGMLFSGFIGSSLRSSYDVLGDSVNLSARMAMKANWGDIWITDSISDIARKYFQTSFLDNYSIRGKTQIVPIYCLCSKKKVHDKKKESPIFGRHMELDYIKGYMEPVFAGKFAGIINIYGDPGIGKSRIIEEISLFAENHLLICKFHCDSILKKAFNPVIFFLNNHFQQFTKDNEKKAENFKLIFNDFIKKTGSLNSAKAQEIKKNIPMIDYFLRSLLSLPARSKEYEELNPKQIRNNFIYAFKSFIKGLSLQKPVIIILEDIQHIDSETKDLIKILLRNIDNYPIVIISTGRYFDDGSKPCLDLDEEIPQKDIIVSSLSEKAIEQLVEYQLKKTPAKALLNFLIDRTIGNPLFLEQYCKYLKDNNYITFKNNRAQITKNLKDIPVKINQIIISRIDRLGDKLKEFLKITSIFRNRFDINIILRCINELKKHIVKYADLFDQRIIADLRESSINELLAEGAKENLWKYINDTQYEFDNTFIPDIIYNMQMTERLKILHIITAEVLEKEFRSEESYMDIAYHYEKARIRPKTIEYLEKAGNHLFDNYRNHMALKIYNKLLDYIDSKTEKIRISSKLARIYLITGNWDRSESIYKHIIEESKELIDKDFLAHTYLNYGVLMQIKAEYESSLKFFNLSEDLYNDLNDEKGLSRVIGSMGNIYLLKGEYDTALKFYERHKKIIKKIGDKKSLAINIGNMGVIYRRKNQLEKAIKSFEMQNIISKEINHLPGIRDAIGNLGITFQSLGQYQKSLKYFLIDSRISKKIGDIMHYGHSLGNIANTYNYLGEITKSIKYHKLSLNIYKELNNHLYIGFSYWNIGDIYLMIYKYDKAIDYYDHALDIFNKNQNISFLSELYNYKAEALYGQKNFKEAKALNDKAREFAQKSNNNNAQIFIEILYCKILCKSNKYLAVERLKQLEVSTKDQYHNGLIHHALYHCFQKEEYRKTALKIFTELNRNKPRYSYRLIINKLEKGISGRGDLNS